MTTVAFRFFATRLPLDPEPDGVAGGDPQRRPLTIVKTSKISGDVLKE